MEPSTDIPGFVQEGFPRQLPENCVEYILVIIDDQLEARRKLSALESVRKRAMQLASSLTKDYIWQRDALNLEVQTDHGLVYLHGSSYFGDTIEDEWLIVYLLRELSKTTNDLWIRVFDSDGEFLLVEAANVLPSWLSPEIDTNRVWINQGSLHLIPLQDKADKRPLDLNQAVEHIRGGRRISPEALYRLEKYPRQIQNAMHHSLTTIPRKLAYILHEKPAAIAPAVEAFYLRDPVSMKSLRSTSGKLSFPPQDLVIVSVKYTKVLFAQLKSQKFTPPPAWTGIMEKVENETRSAEAAQENLARLEVGMKLTSGFEMLASNATTKNNRTAREVAILLEDLEEDGDQALPSDAVIESWPGATQDDDESWMDINYEEFEKALDGKGDTKRGETGGFGDASAQADLQKMVARFESFLNDETAGIEGAELDDMDEDDDSSDYEDSEDEDKDVSFDEEQFAKMMRAMMGMPVEESTRSKQPWRDEDKKGQVEEVDEQEDEEIRQLTTQMEAELNSHGALQLDPTSRKLKVLKQKSATDDRGKGVQHDNESEESDDDGEEVDIDYNLAKNLLESFKSQGGTAGPVGNMLGMFGMQLPRDEEHAE
ncbi:SGT1-domain-containing protein [Apiospora saccharicola]|uniref:SGT1-domain-containing protein n=1 Tax=Apiospora saccharicola TaxID=335842 RepID=A0ABR1U406_9PEZI